MTWSFDDSSLSSSKKDQVRLLVGDTNTDDQLLSDEAIEFYLDDNGSNVDLASAIACEAIAASFARDVDTKNSRLSVAASKRMEHYSALAKQLRKRASELASPFFGGQSRQGKVDLETDSDAIQPRFYRGQDSATRYEDQDAPRWWNRD